MEKAAALELCVSAKNTTSDGEKFGGKYSSAL